MRIPNIGLVNVVAGRTVAREFVQDDLQPQEMAAALAPLLDAHSTERARMVVDLDEVRARLGEPGAAERVAQLVSDLAA